MSSEERGCCDKCAKTFIMLINVVIILIGGAILGAGIYWQLSDTGFYKEIFNHDIFNVPIVCIVIGSLLLLVGLAGFMGACCEALFLLKVYMAFLIIIMLVEIIIAVGCVAMKSSVETYATERTLEMIGFYGDDTADEAGIITKTIDEIQENFECCGVYGPEDWGTNTAYKNGDDITVPTSCCTAQYASEADCGNYVRQEENDKIYKTGCKTSMMNFVENNLLYVGICAGVIVIFQMCGLLLCNHYIIKLEDDKFEFYSPLQES